MKKIKKEWLLTAAVAVIALTGLALRLLYPGDMEYKEDEAYYFVQSQIIGKSGYWPWVGIPSGAYLRNPGGTIWIFAALARLTGALTPTAVSTALRWFQWFSLFLIFPTLHALAKTLSLKRDAARRWAIGVFAWAMVNPFLIYYARKLWTQAFLPAFTCALLLSYLHRKSPRAAFAWGLVGACLGQIHMSGFFFAFGIAAVTVLSQNARAATPLHSWGAWFMGSVLGALPLLPWLWDAWQNTPTETMTRGWSEALQLKYWVFSLTQPVGLHLGNALGVHRGPSQWDQLSDFVRYPLLGETPTYLCGIAHLALLGILIVFLWRRGLSGLQFLRALRNARKERGNASWRDLLVGVLGIGGAVLTFTGVQIRRYYVAVSFPLDTALFLRHLPLALWIIGGIAQAIISASFVQTVHRNAGAPQGDYGPAYHTMVER